MQMCPAFRNADVLSISMHYPRALLASSVASGPMSHRRLPRVPLARRFSPHALSLVLLKLALVITSPHSYAPAGAVIAVPMVNVYATDSLSYVALHALSRAPVASRHHCTRLLYVTATVRRTRRGKVPTSTASTPSNFEYNSPIRAYKS